MADIVRAHGANRGSAPAITFEGRTLTWADLDARTSQVANGLAALGLGAQDRLAFIDKNGPEYFEVFFGAGKINAVTVAVNWRLAPGEMAYIINHAESKVLFVGPEFLPHLEKIEGDLTTVKHVIVLGDDASRTTYEAWLAEQPATDPGVVAAGDDVCFQLYTSGTTGLPKGVMLTNDNLFAMLPNVADLWGVFEGQGLGCFQDLDALTMFADYKVPQLLRAEGILAYTPELAAKIAAREPLPAESPEEVEIRAATVWGVELLRRALAERGVSARPFELDWLLWTLAQDRPNMEPYHRTRTVFY